MYLVKRNSTFGNENDASESFPPNIQHCGLDSGEDVDANRNCIHKRKLCNKLDLFYIVQTPTFDVCRVEYYHAYIIVNYVKHFLLVNQTICLTFKMHIIFFPFPASSVHIYYAVNLFIHLKKFYRTNYSLKMHIYMIHSNI